MSVNNSYRIKRYRPEVGVFTPVKTLIDTNFVVLRNAGSVAVVLSTDANDPDSYDDLQPGTQQVVGPMKIVGYISQPFPGLNAPTRFPAGTTVLLLKATESGADVRVQFVL